MGKSRQIVQANDFLEILMSSRGTNQKPMTRIGTINSNRLTVYPYGDGLGTAGSTVAERRTVCSVRAAGTAIMATMATTSRKLETEEGCGDWPVMRWS